MPLPGVLSPNANRRRGDAHLARLARDPRPRKQAACPRGRGDLHSVRSGTGLPDTRYVRGRAPGGRSYGGEERPMTPALILSSDSHVFEPPDLWTTRIDRAFRDRAPRKFGIHIGHMGGPLGEMRKLWKFADAKGFDWFSVSDHLQESPPRGGDMSCYEAIATLTAAAMDTQRIRLGSGVYCVAYRNPGLLAKSLTTIDHLSYAQIIRLLLDPEQPRASFERRGQALPRGGRPEQSQAAAAPYPHLDRGARRAAHAPGGRAIRRRMEWGLHRAGRLEAQGLGPRPVVREGGARPEDDHAHRESRVLSRGRRQGRGARRRGVPRA